MTAKLFFLPVITQILLTFWMYIRLARAKARAIREGRVDEARRALHDDAWPDDVLQINNNIRNQFELPVIFYALMLMAWNLGFAGVVLLVTAWLFVLTRIVHAAIHTGSNYVPLRRNVFMLGALVLITMTLTMLIAFAATWL